MENCEGTHSNRTRRRRRKRRAKRLITRYWLLCCLLGMLAANIIFIRGIGEDDTTEDDDSVVVQTTCATTTDSDTLQENQSENLDSFMDFENEYISEVETVFEDVTTSVDDEKFEDTVTSDTIEKEALVTETQKASEKIVYKPRYEVTDSEYNMLCKLVFAEVTRREHQTKGKEMTAIAAVVLKRTFDEPDYPNTIEQVLNEDSQFSPVEDGVIYWYSNNGRVPVKDSDITHEVKMAVNRALEGEDPTKAMIKGGAIYYYSEPYFEKLPDSNYEKRVRNAITEDIQFGDTVFHRQYPKV